MPFASEKKRKEWSKQYYEDNKQRILAQNKQYNKEHKEERKAYNKEYSKAWYQRNKEKEREKSKRYQEENKEEIKAKAKIYRQTPRAKELARARGRKYNRRIRSEVLERLGGICVKCGFTDTRALQIDHIHGDGPADRKNIGYSVVLHLYILKLPLEEAKEKYQVLCANCNVIKAREMNEVATPKING